MNASFLKVVGLAALLNTTASAQIVLNTIARGWVSSIPEAPDVVDTTNDSYCTGFLDDPLQPFELRSFYIFELPDSLGEVLWATPVLYAPTHSYAGGSSIELSFFDVELETAVALLEGRIGTPGLFEDLGTGECFGTFTVGPEMAGTYVDFPIRHPLVDRINETDGLLAIGCRVTRSDYAGEEYVFGYTGWAAQPADGHTSMYLWTVEEDDIPVGPMPIPEPSAMAAMAAATLLLGAMLRRYQRRRCPV